MLIIHVASELAPVAKVGGLGDVIYGLCRALAQKGHQVEVVLPKYDCIDYSQIKNLRIDTQGLLSFCKGEWVHNTIWSGYVEEIKVYLIEPHNSTYYFNRGSFYGCPDDIERYTYFSRTTLEFLHKTGKKVDVLHFHDWQTAAIAPLYNDIYKGLGFDKSTLVFTIHNLEYQGQCAPCDLDHIGLKGESYLSQDKLGDNHNLATINLLKGGIVYSNFVTTVSPNYAKEVITPEGGRGLDKTLRQYQSKFQGILNGIDYGFWNPRTDRYLPAHYSWRNLSRHAKAIDALEEKALIKKHLRDRLALTHSHSPLVSCITRLVPQKGIALIKHAIYRTLEKGGQFVLLGSSPIPEIHKEFLNLQLHFSDNPGVHLELEHHEELAHLIYGGSDMLIVPSIFEPCGLTQLIAMRYGTIPIVRRTGGLADTVFDVDYSGKEHPNPNGYVFDTPDQQGIQSALDRAIDCWFTAPEKWRKVVNAAMKMDFSWKISSEKYLEIYQKK